MVRFIKAYLNQRYLSKYLIAHKLLSQYLEGFPEPRNCFYYAGKANLSTLLQAIAFIKNETNSIGFDKNDQCFVRDIAKAKKLQYGKYTHKFSN